MHMKPTLDFASGSAVDFGPAGPGLSNAAPLEASAQELPEDDPRDPPPPPGSSLQDVMNYYGGKTAAILRRYGPGPRVHYHAGLVDELEDLQAQAHVLRRRLVVSQERLLFHAAQVWNAASTMSGQVLDVGCGLGGGSLFCAQECGGLVTAVTSLPAHATFLRRFA